MNFNVSINCDNAAFDDDLTGIEICRIFIVTIKSGQLLFRIGIECHSMEGVPLFSLTWCVQHVRGNHSS